MALKSGALTTVDRYPEFSLSLSQRTCPPFILLLLNRRIRHRPRFSLMKKCSMRIHPIPGPRANPVAQSFATVHYGTKPGHFEGVNEQTDERVAQYLRLYSCLFQTTVQCTATPTTLSTKRLLQHDKYNPRTAILMKIQKSDTKRKQNKNKQ